MGATFPEQGSVKTMRIPSIASIFENKEWSMLVNTFQAYPNIIEKADATYWNWVNQQIFEILVQTKM